MQGLRSTSTLMWAREKAGLRQPLFFSFLMTSGGGWIGKEAMCKCMRQPVPPIAARHTIAHNHSVTDDVLVVGTTEVPGLGTL